MKKTDDMIKIEELARQTGLNASFIGKCYRELKETVLRPPVTEKGENNSTWFSSNAVVIFKEISKEKEKGLSWPAIKRRLWSEFEIRGENLKTEPSKPAEKLSEEGSRTTSDKELGVINDLQNQARDADRRRHEMEKEKLRVEGDLRELKATLRPYLPEGGNADSLHQRFNEYNKKLSQVQLLVDQLEVKTKSGWIVFGHSSEVVGMWKKLKDLVQECLKG